MTLPEKKFVTIRELGKGGMATVYLAKSKELNRLVAVKVLNREILSDTEYIKRFFREARITAALEHPNIIKIIESNFEDNLFYIVTEFINGGDFNSIFKSTKLSIKEKLAITNKIISALDYAHKKGIVHRDIKPSNILLSKENEPHLCDFGIATALWGQESRLTRTNQLMGTMDYIAPEQKEDSKSVTFSADIYSIGVVLYKVLTGRKPMGAFKPPMDVNKQISKSLNEIVLKCLQPLPVDRFKSAGNLFEAIENEINNKSSIVERSDTIISIEETAPPKKASLETLIDTLTTGSVSSKLKAKSTFLSVVDFSDKARLLELLDHSEGILKETVIEAVGQLSVEEACKPLIELLNDSYYNKTVAKALSSLKCKDMEDKLIEHLKSDRADAYIALEPLSKIGTSKATKPVSTFLKNPHEWIRKMALDTLAEIDDSNIYGYINKVAVEDKESSIRARAKKILEGRKK